MIKRLNVNPAFGVNLVTNLSSANFTIIDFGLHYHPKPVEGTVLEMDDVCTFRVGIYFTLFGIGIRIGTFWNVIGVSPNEDGDEETIDF